MTDSDIQFLGNWNSPQASTTSSFVSAIVLVPMDGSVARTYSRAQTSCVHIGRVSNVQVNVATRPSPDPEDTATFANPVMSRLHAKITFTDAGSAYIIDTNSHHGTWVSRPTSVEPKIKLDPESPYMLLDGDRITFGKEVIKAGTSHLPLTVLVKLLRTTSSTSSPVALPRISTVSPKPRNRFGLDNSESDSSDSESAIDKPSLESDVIHIELPSNTSCIKRSKSSVLTSPSSKSSTSVASSPPSLEKISTIPKASPTRHQSNTSSPALSDSEPLDSLELQPPGLDVLATGNQSDKPAPTPEIMTPPWRRAGALSYSCSHLDGRPFDRLSRALDRLRVMRSSDRSMPLLGLYEDNMRETYESIRERHGSDKEDGSHVAVDVNAKLEKLQNSHEVLSTRFDDLATQLTAVKDSVNALQDRDHAPSDETQTIQVTLESLRDELEELEDQIAVVQDDVSSGNVDVGALRVDLATLRAGYKDQMTNFQESVKTQANGVTLLRGDIDKLRADVLALPQAVETISRDFSVFRSEHSDVRDEVARWEKDLATLKENLERVDVIARKAAEDIQSGIAQKIREEILQESRDRAAESPAGGARKRGYDEAFPPDNEPSTSAVLAPEPHRPSKRLRTVLDLAAVGVLGAFSAYIGLAYLQL